MTIYIFNMTLHMLGEKIQRQVMGRTDIHICTLTSKVPATCGIYVEKSCPIWCHEVKLEPKNEATPSSDEDQTRETYTGLYQLPLCSCDKMNPMVAKSNLREKACFRFSSSGIKSIVAGRVGHGGKARKLTDLSTFFY